MKTPPPIKTWFECPGCVEEWEEDEDHEIAEFQVKIHFEPGQKGTYDQPGYPPMVDYVEPVDPLECEHDYDEMYDAIYTLAQVAFEQNQLPIPE